MKNTSQDSKNVDATMEKNQMKETYSGMKTEEGDTIYITSFADGTTRIAVTKSNTANSVGADLTPKEVDKLHEYLSTIKYAIRNEEEAPY